MFGTVALQHFCNPVTCIRMTTRRRRRDICPPQCISQRRRLVLPVDHHPTIRCFDPRAGMVRYQRAQPLRCAIRGKKPSTINGMTAGLNEFRRISDVMQPSGRHQQLRIVDYPDRSPRLFGDTSNVFPSAVKRSQSRTRELLGPIGEAASHSVTVGHAGHRSASVRAERLSGGQQDPRPRSGSHVGGRPRSGIANRAKLADFYPARLGSGDLQQGYARGRLLS